MQFFCWTSFTYYSLEDYEDILLSEETERQAIILRFPAIPFEDRLLEDECDRVLLKKLRTRPQVLTNDAELREVLQKFRVQWHSGEFVTQDDRTAVVHDVHFMRLRDVLSKLVDIARNPRIDSVVFCGNLWLRYYLCEASFWQLYSQLTPRAAPPAYVMIKPNDPVPREKFILVGGRIQRDVTLYITRRQKSDLFQCGRDFYCVDGPGRRRVPQLQSLRHLLIRLRDRPDVIVFEAIANETGKDDLQALYVLCVQGLCLTNVSADRVVATMV